MLVNLTPHPVTICAQDGGAVLTVPPSGTVARIAESHTPGAPVDGVPGVMVTLGEVEGLPDPAPDVTCVVSTPLAMGLLAARMDRRDVVYPADMVRDSDGRIIGCRSLARLRS